MAEPRSIKVEPWSDFPRYSYSFINDDFCHEKNFVAKITAKTARSVIKIKQSLTSKSGNWNVADEVKLWFDLPKNRSFYTKVKSSDYLKIHYDNGPTVWNNKIFNFYGTFNTNKQLNKASIKAGVLHDSEHCHSDNRIKLTLQQNQNQWHWYHRTSVYHKKYVFGVLGVVDINRKILQKNALLLGYKIDQNNDFYLRTEVKGFRKSAPKQPKDYFDYILADYIKRIDDKSKIGIEAGVNLKDFKIYNANLVYERIPKKGESYKIGFNNNLDISFVHKRPLYGLEDIAKISFGLGVSGIKQQDIRVRNGLEVSINL